MASRRYTNADTVRKPLTVKIERALPGPRPYQPSRDAEALDQVLSEGLTIDEIMARAKQSTSRPTVVSKHRRQEGDRLAAQAQARAEAESTLGGQLRAHPAAYARRGVMGAAIPLTFAGGGVGAAASMPLAIQALTEFAEDPSVMRGVLAGATAIPGARWFSKGAKAAPGMTQATWLRGKKPSEVAAMVDRWTPERPPKSLFNRWSPNTSASSTSVVDDLTELPRPRFNRWMPNTPADRPSMASLANEAPELSVVNEIPTAQATPTPSAIESLLGGLREQLKGISPSRMRTTSGAPTARRVPMGACGDEYAEIRSSGGAFDKRWTQLTPEEEAAQDEFWSLLARGR